MTNCIVRIRKAGLWLAVAGYAGCALGQGGATDLTETGAVERALGRPALQALYAGALETAAGDLVQARTLSNPVLGLEREQLRGSPANERQSTYTISQRLELGGKRGLRRCGKCTPGRVGSRGAGSAENRRLRGSPAISRGPQCALEHRRAGGLGTPPRGSRNPCAIPAERR